MIRMALFAIAFVAITVALVVYQPGAKRHAAQDEPTDVVVTRAEGALDPVATPQSLDAVVLPSAQPAADIALPSEQPEDIAPVAQPRISMAPAPVASDLDDQSLRRMTWDTLSSLNQATGRERAPGQPGSLLHTIVRRSLDEAPAHAAPSADVMEVAAVYLVQPGDSLVSIAEKVYGDVNMTGPLFAANQELLSRPDDLRAGLTLVLPPK